VVMAVPVARAVIVGDGDVIPATYIRRHVVAVAEPTIRRSFYGADDSRRPAGTALLIVVVINSDNNNDSNNDSSNDSSNKNDNNATTTTTTARTIMVSPTSTTINLSYDAILMDDSTLKGHHGGGENSSNPSLQPDQNSTGTITRVDCSGMGPTKHKHAFEIVCVTLQYAMDLGEPVHHNGKQRRRYGSNRW
jgi:hypothetical protein